MRALTPYNPQLPDVETPENTGPTEWRDVSAFLSALRRRWRLFAAIVGGFVLLVGAVTIIVPKTYTTTVRMMAGNPAPATGNDNPSSLPILNALLMQSGVQSAETLATIAQQENVAADVTKSLKLHIDPGALLRRISVTPTVNTAILNISVSWKDPVNSARIANAFANAFMWRERDLVRSQAVTALGFLSTEIPRAKEQMERAGSELAQFQATNGFVDAGSHTQDVVAKATGIESKIDTAQLDRREAQALLSNASAQLASLPATINNAHEISVNPVLTDMRTKLEQLNTQLAQAREQYTEQHPTVVALRKQQQDLAARIARQPQQIDSSNTLAPNPVYQSLQQQIVQYRQRIDGDDAQIALLQRQRASMAPTLSRLPSQSMLYTSLEQRAKLASDVYNALEQKYNEATIAKTTAISDISILQPAYADSAVVRPQLKINLLVALIVGIVLGAITVACVEMYRRTVRELPGQGLFGLPVLARIPVLETSNRRMLPWLQSMTLEAFLQLCVSLKLKNKRRLRTLAVTSPTRGDGKSTIAFNLAKAMSNLEPRVLLIDADLRRPTIHMLAQCSNELGLSDVLEGGAKLSDAVQQLSGSLDVLAAGHSVVHPVGLMQSSVFDEIITEASQRYDMVIVDTPALSCVTDGYLVTAKTDGSVLVVSADVTGERETREAVTRFEALGIENLVGIVLNRDHQRISDYGDYFAGRFEHALPGSTA